MHVELRSTYTTRVTSHDKPTTKAASGRTKKPGSETNKPDDDAVAPCSVRGCNRQSYARGLCQTHHRQFLKKGRVEAIRPYRVRRAGTVKLSGLRVSTDTAKALRDYASANDISIGAMIADVLENWHAHQKQQGEGRRKVRDRSGPA